jgi:N-acetylneuraminate synthase
MTNAKEITSLDPKFIKVPSTCNTNFEMLQWLCEKYFGEIQLSFGMTMHKEEEQIVQLFEKNKRQKDLVLLVRPAWAQSKG